MTGCPDDGKQDKIDLMQVFMAQAEKTLKYQKMVSELQQQQEREQAGRAEQTPSMAVSAVPSPHADDKDTTKLRVELNAANAKIEKLKSELERRIRMTPAGHIETFDG